MLQITMNSEKYYHSEYNIESYDWNQNNYISRSMNNNNDQDLGQIFNSRYSDEEQYNKLCEIEYNEFQNPFINAHEMPLKNEFEEFMSSEKQYNQEDYGQQQNYLQYSQYQPIQLRSQQSINKHQSNRSQSVSSDSSAHDNSIGYSKSSSSSKDFRNEDSQNLSFDSISASKNQNEESSQHKSTNSAKNRQSQHKNVVKNIGLGFKNYLIDSKSPLNSRIQDILKENRITHFEFRNWINQSVKLDQKKEIYKALNIKNQDNIRIQNFKNILNKLFQIFFEEQYALTYLLKNSNIQNRDIHIQFIKHFIISSRDIEYLLKKWK
ncbi:hypothetical protein ABPG74_004377 [Tetrahymena malaccensis]